MATRVRLNDEFVSEAKAHANVEARSVPKQIEYWAKTGKVMIDNPDLPYEFVKETLVATAEVTQGLVKRHVRRTKRDRD
ncbi:ParD-like family protein [Vibrio tubiashii]|uniref:ParD-like family protein n=1 Tax=Vibrio tubiashii TaxID=29498 RepID=UPI001EFEB984|nr:ParD-like family protein [Vibrio tubiashii]MCG9576131.1 ParD-like family protein [Vibrio tubiashii]